MFSTNIQYLKTECVVVFLCNHVVYDKDFNFKEIEPNRIWVQESVEFVYNLLGKEN